VVDPIVRLGAPGTCDPLQSVSSVRGVLWENPWVRQLVPMKSNSDVIRWSMKGGASIPLCTSGTIWLTLAPGRPAQYTVPASVVQAVCIATLGSARINVAY